MVDPDRLSAAFETARCDLLAEHSPAGHWVGQLTSSPLATATAISALTLAERQAPSGANRKREEQRGCALSEMIMVSLRWLARQQNTDGGWGDVVGGRSNPAATLLVRSAFALTCVPAEQVGMLERADAYLAGQGGVRGIKRRYADDMVWTTAILTNAALAGVIPWSQVPSLAFERLAWSPTIKDFLNVPELGDSLPVFAAVGQARHAHRSSRNPLNCVLRSAGVDKNLQRIAAGQSAGGGYLASVPWTSFVVMSLTDANAPKMSPVQTAIVRRGVDFLLECIRRDGSWAISPDLATRNTAQAVAALTSSGDDLRELPGLNWLLTNQQPSGAWSTSHVPGAEPNVADTSTALLALAPWWQADEKIRVQLGSSATAAVRWLLGLQNADGGWPTFVHDSANRSAAARSQRTRSAVEITADVLRALHFWHTPLVESLPSNSPQRGALGARISQAIERGLRYLTAAQQPSGGWQSTWITNQEGTAGNAIHGTARVLLAFADLNQLAAPSVARAVSFLALRQRADGSWLGSTECPGDKCATRGSIEETAWAVEALFRCTDAQSLESVTSKGVSWLIDQVEANRHHEPAPLGLYFAPFAFAERVQPLAATLNSLALASHRLSPRSVSPPAPQSVKI